ncbi:hypothetical protein [uncultured Campylobacter sp.]|uniref:hypothetical protein n=1 Tax=uncultured Campylobacter sp. TaxID=218934 RepID=UPI002625652E|nr:hypothetical protein [uncultured Campylobacter sp.]
MEKFCRWRGEISPQNSNNKASHPHYFLYSPSFAMLSNFVFYPSKFATQAN